MKGKLNNDDKASKASKREWMESIIIVIAVIVINIFVFSLTTVSGESMNPTLGNGDRLILKKYETLLKTEEYKRGDIVVFKSPLDEDNRSFIKRVVGIPGDKINILGGKLYINNEYINNEYINNEYINNEYINNEYINNEYINNEYINNEYINNEYINEPYIKNKSFTESLSYGENYVVPEDEIFVMGDNRLSGGSNDSRSFGSISIREIKGKAVLRVFPFNKIGKDFK